MTLNFELALTGSLQERNRKVTRAMLEADRQALKTAGDGLKAELRQQVIRAGMPRRLAFTWRGQLYPKNGLAYDPVYQVWSLADEIISFNTTGEVVTGREGQGFLVFPIEGSPAEKLRAVRVGNRAPSHFQAAKQRFGELQFVPLKGRGPVVGMYVVQNVGLSKTGRLGRKQLKTLKSGAFRSRAVSVPLFWATRQVRGRRVLEPARAFSKAGRRLERLRARYLQQEITAAMRAPVSNSRARRRG